MELKTKYQYTYFIHPFIIKEERYTNYLLKLLKDPKCNLKIFEKEKDLDIYTYFSSTIRKYLFPTFSFTKDKIKTLEKMDKQMQATLLSNDPCTMFNYDLGQNAQGKAGKGNGIFFKISKVEIICFKSGICFLAFKTHIDSEDLDDVLNFNYKFRDINSNLIGLREFENIKIQTNCFENAKEISKWITTITGEGIQNNEIDISTDRFYTYSYTCLDQQVWNGSNPFDAIEHEFLKYCNILPSNDRSSFNKEAIEENVKVISKWNYIRYGFSKMGSCLLTSSVDMNNYTKLPFTYEHEYFYTYIFSLYKKIYVTKLNEQYKRKLKGKKTRKQFNDFTKKVWKHEITNDDTGSLMVKYWNEALELDKLYADIQNKYDILYQQFDIDKTVKINKIMLGVLIASLLLNIINFILLFNGY